MPLGYQMQQVSRTLLEAVSTTAGLLSSAAPLEIYNHDGSVIPVFYSLYTFLLIYTRLFSDHDQGHSQSELAVSPHLVISAYRDRRSIYMSDKTLGHPSRPYCFHEFRHEAYSLSYSYSDTTPTRWLIGAYIHT
jgi:hypothetical protein